ncbi:collagen alpha-1(I) chain-like [Bos indicus x Bos taurus]|uniref:collagen alpha-1(I) chain-like n=1 Tax=Bos indicus x Bos taurus TaxID=30522 RepID=UPI000F7D1896|nr:collagen alpha-1(I) chain-like [Bos indicus x Bos taurus]
MVDVKRVGVAAVVVLEMMKMVEVAEAAKVVVQIDAEAVVVEIRTLTPCLDEAPKVEERLQRPSSRAPQDHAAGFRGLHLPRGDRVLLHPVSEEREADSSLSDPGHPHAREKEVAQRTPSRPWPGLPLRAGSRSLRSAPPPPRAALGNEPAAKAAGGLGDRARACGSAVPGAVARRRAPPTGPRPAGPRPSPHAVRGPAAAEAEGPPPGSQRAGGEGTTCPARAGAGGAGRARLPEPERTPAAAPGPIRTRRRPSRAPVSRARADASSWTARWGLSGRERTFLHGLEKSCDYIAAV